MIDMWMTGGGGGPITIHYGVHPSRAKLELQLARIAKGREPNRTPGPKFLRSRGIPTGGPDTSGKATRLPDSVSGGRLPDTTQEAIDQRTAGNVTQQATPEQAQSLGFNAPPTPPQSAQSGNLATFLNRQRLG